MWRHLRTVAVPLALVAIAACSIRDAACGGRAPSGSEATSGELTGAQAGGTGSARFKIVFLGDSVTAGLGVLSDEAYPMVIQEKFAAEGYQNVEVINAGVSGDTTAGGVRRLDGLLEADTKIVVVALGGNDALRGLSATQTRENLAAIIEAARAAGAAVLLAGMEAPTNLGPDYQRAFHASFIQLAHDYKDTVVFVPFLLEGVAGRPELNQADGIHPNKDGARSFIAESLYPKLRVMIDAMGGGG